ncbi:hypothetical protein Taro_047956, partial [Colocasia esculenta]|nr:hypothetical protein [Colocasia esculenta]
MDCIPAIFTFKNEAYVIPIHRGMKICSVVNDVCRRWTLVKEQVELKCHILKMSNSVMKLLNGEDIDRIINMHEILGQKMISIDVHVSGSEEIITFRASGEQSSVNNNIGSNVSTSSSEDMRLRSDLWQREQNVIHST